MKKTMIFDGDGKTRDERETCFPYIKSSENIKNKGAGMR